METLEEQFNTRVSAFLGRTGMRPTTLGMKAVGDPNLLRQIARGRSPSLRTADRILAYIAGFDQDPGRAQAPPGRTRRSRPGARARRTRKSRAETENAMERRTRPPTRFLRVSEVQARTGLSRSTIYRWSAEGRFPQAIRLSERVVRWVEAEVEDWIRERIARSSGVQAHRRQRVRG